MTDVSNGEVSNGDCSPDNTTITGNAEPGSTVTVTYANGNVIGTATADETTGDYTVTTTPRMRDGKRARIDPTGGKGNTSPEATVPGDTGASG